MHNTYTPRGARVRDTYFWGCLFYHLYSEFGEEVKAICQGHGVAHFKIEGRPDNLKRFLMGNAAAYKFPNDQALHLANKGVKLNEAGNEIVIPEQISKTWYVRDQYGNYSFNARGAIQRVLGFYDGNPVNLLPLPERELAAKLVEFIGSEDLILATITNNLVFHNPKNMKARSLCADALEQLGYQAITGLWRKLYLCAASELRHPEAASSHKIRCMDNKDVMPFVSTSLILDYLEINFDGKKAINIEKAFVVEIKDSDEFHFYKGTVFHGQIKKSKIPNGATVVRLYKTDLYELATKSYKNENCSDQNEKEIIQMFQRFIVDTSKYRNFNIVEPLSEDI